MSDDAPRTRRIEVMLILLALAIATGWFVGGAPIHRDGGRLSKCSGNLRGIMNSMYIYAEFAQEKFPMATIGPSDGALSFFAYRQQPPLPTDAPSPSADLWLMLRLYYNSPAQFVCPLGTDTPDPIQDPERAFDFAGPGHLSYGYHYQHHPNRRPLGTWSDPRIPLLADANPYLKGGVTRAVSADRNSIAKGNSTNHRGRKGQCVIFVDGHASYMRTPRTPFLPADRFATTTMPADNIYTTHADNESDDPGNAPTWTRIQIGSKSDYCLVP